MTTTIEEVSAKAEQYIVITYPMNAPTRMVYPNNSASNPLREVTLNTAQAVGLYNDLRRALFD